MTEQFSRTESLLGQDAMRVLATSRVAVFGVGGVGGYAAEALARSGVGTLDIIDNDTVALSNLNRQIIATHSTVGKYKVDVMRERILDINPDAKVHAHRCFYLPETKNSFDFTQFDYVVDAVDTVTAKIQIVLEARRAGIPVISSMGAGNKLDPTAFEVADIYETSVCPLAKVMRRELKKRGVEKLKVVYSREAPAHPAAMQQACDSAECSSAEYRSAECSSAEYHSTECSSAEYRSTECNSAGWHPEACDSAGCSSVEYARADACSDGAEKTGSHDLHRRAVPGSVAFVPSVAGLILAGEVIKDLIGIGRP